MTKRQEFFALFDELAVQFSNMEGFVAHVLETLIDQSHPLIAGLITTDLPLSKKIQHIRTLTRYRLCHDPATESRVFQVIQRVDELRVERNSFVHGIWVLDESLLSQSCIKCSDPRWKASKTEKSWSRMHDQEWTFERLRERITRVGNVVADLIHLYNDLKAASLVG